MPRIILSEFNSARHSRHIARAFDDEELVQSADNTVRFRLTTASIDVSIELPKYLWSVLLSELEAAEVPFR